MGANYSDSDFWDDYDDEFLDNLVDRLESPEPEDELLAIGISGYYSNEEDEEEFEDDDDEDNYYIPKREKPTPSVTITFDELDDYIKKYRELLFKLEENNISTKDLHGENIGQINGELVHFDVMAF
jgi:hypothetical protein